MKRFLLVISLLVFTFLFILSSKTFACGEAGDICCNTYTSLQTYEGYCNGDYVCNPGPLFSQFPDEPGNSVCENIPCGYLDEPCCSGTCKQAGLVCNQALTTAYKDVCSTPLTPVPFNPGNTGPKCDDNKTTGIQTAIGCIGVEDANAFATSILRLGTSIGGGIALALMLYGVFIITTSAGIPDKLNAGKEIISSAATGLIFILLAIFLVTFIGINVLGIPGLT